VVAVGGLGEAGHRHHESRLVEGLRRVRGNRGRSSGRRSGEKSNQVQVDSIDVIGVVCSSELI
jgi:hypothetical protein